MLIQKPAESPKKEQLKIALEEKIYQEINAYCSQADITIEHFIEQAAMIVFKKDKTWREWKKQQGDI